ncbi:MAG: hypothetical protein HY554_01185 [Elusimicrobia bacterium]|nr:hypothetical protein [Elusimicrobiota bacterium]
MTPSKNPSPCSDSRDGPALELLRALLARPQAHARFLNTLSLLEHIGSRKILLSRGASPLGEGELRHLAEEARHALFFRRAAERVARRPMGYGAEDLLSPSAARMYMGRLDAEVARRLGPDIGQAYRYVTLAVELRALWFYRLYERVLREAGEALTLAGILREENGHLSEMEGGLRASDARYGARRRAFTALERRLFARWLAAVREAAAEGEGARGLSSAAGAGQSRSGRSAGAGAGGAQSETVMKPRPWGVDRNIRGA